MDLIDHYTRSGLISDPTRHFRTCHDCGERFSPDDMHTIDIEKYGEHDTAEICDGCKEGHTDTPRVAEIDLDNLNLDENPPMPTPEHLCKGWLCFMLATDPDKDRWKDGLCPDCLDEIEREQIREEQAERKYQS